LSSQPPKRQAAITPNGTAISTASVMVISASETVGSSRWLMSVVTLVL
jgi:hypothetical protein